MGRNNWLKTLGLYVNPAFLPAALCREIGKNMVAGDGEPATVDVTDTASGVLPQTRQTTTVHLPTALDAMLHARVLAAAPELGRFFGLPLTTAEPLNYLRYGPGDFYRPHVDRRVGATPGTAAGERQISVVVFLNQPGGDDGYEGGELRLFNLIDEPAWRDAGFACDPEPGLLVAFRSDILHEVTPVTRGVRLTIATWLA